MEYSNPHIPEGINTSEEHPLKEFFWLLGGVLAGLLGMVLILVLIADQVADKIPFGVEQEMTAGRFRMDPAPPQLQAYLDRLARRISAAEELPPEMSVRVNYKDSEVVNAAATLGGNIIMFRGLLEKVPNENALAMVVAHEIAHLKHRDPIRGAGRGAVVGLALSMISGAAGNAVLDGVLSQGANLTLLKYGREQEQAADDVALDALQHIYGGVEGAEALLHVLQKEHGDFHGLEFFSTHPLISHRIAHAHELVSKNQNAAAAPTPLPEDFEDWLKSDNPPTGTD